MYREITRLTLFATAAFLASSESVFAGEEIAFDRARLDDPAYVAALHNKIEAAARKPCRATYRGDTCAASPIRGCTRTAVMDAIKDIGDPNLTAYASNKPRPPKRGGAG